MISGERDRSDTGIIRCWGKHDLKDIPGERYHDGGTQQGSGYGSH